MRPTSLLLFAALAVLAAGVRSPSPTPTKANQAVAVEAGGDHTCALTAGGSVKCWGDNFFGQLGDQEACGLVCPTSVDVQGLSSGVSAIASGGSQSCAIAGSGVKCWGRNDAGQLGVETNQICTGSALPCSSAPVDVTGLTSAMSQVSTSGGASCALATNGEVKCWGRNDTGQLGNGTTTDDGVFAPVDVVGLDSGVAAVAAGTNHSCAVTDEGGVKCWGFNGEGELGDGTLTSHSSPVEVTGLDHVVAVTVGLRHTCALTNAGRAKCWGDNGFGQLGDGGVCASPCTGPIDVSGLASGVIAVEAADRHTCALTETGVKCWGGNNSRQLGAPAPDSCTFSLCARTPVDVIGLPDGVMAISVDGQHSCAGSGDGSVRCWGWNGEGKLGDGTTDDPGCHCRPSPVDVVGLGPGPKPTPAATPTPTTSPVPPPTSSPSITPTATVARPAGDANCDLVANSLDAAFVLQFVASLIAALPCPQGGDVNSDGRVTAIDAALILQRDAGLLG